MIGDFLDKYTYEHLLTEALRSVPDTVDKRQGSIIYDTLAVCCAQLAQGYLELKNYYYNTYALTAEGEYLEYRAAEVGLVRFDATRAVLRGMFYTDGSTEQPFAFEKDQDPPRFSAVNSDVPLTYVLTGPYIDDNGDSVPGCYLLQCETPGTVGNSYSGPILPLSNNLYKLSAATLLSNPEIPGADRESDADLRARYLRTISHRPFGGNVAQYQQWVTEMDGVRAVQVYPVWNGGGTVKCSIVDTEYAPAETTLIKQVQDALYPVPAADGAEGEGLGIAPIGHVVTVSTPDRVLVDVSCTLTLTDPEDADGVRTAAREKLEDYLAGLRRTFGSTDAAGSYSMWVYRAHVISALLEIPGVVNVTGLKLGLFAAVPSGNGFVSGAALRPMLDEDLELLQNAEAQQLPFAGTVSVNG